MSGTVLKLNDSDQSQRNAITANCLTVAYASMLMLLLLLQT